jgi:DNA-binding NarL/FixJ family response regulator
MHIKALLQVNKRMDFTDTLACIVFDLEDAIVNTEFTSKERLILRMYKNGATIADIAKELNCDYWTIDDRVDSIVGKIINTFYKSEEDWYY